MDQLAIDDLWRDHRSYVLGVAFRMLGDIGDAEDVVQEAFTRLVHADRGEIRDVRGWLVVVVSRLCLDHLGSARMRRETRHEPGSAAFALAAGGPDPADRVTLDESVRDALLVVLRELSPAERTAFVLHEVFQYPFETVATIVGRSPAACRQLASRARRRIAEDAATSLRFVVEPSDERRIADEFVAACAGGRLDRLVQILDPDVAGRVDLGGVERPPVIGRDRVAQNALLFFGPASGTTLVTQPVGGQPGALVFRGRRLVATLRFDTRGGRVSHIRATADPDAFLATDPRAAEQPPSPRLPPSTRG